MAPRVTRPLVPVGLNRRPRRARRNIRPPGSATLEPIMRPWIRLDDRDGIVLKGGGQRKMEGCGSATEQETTETRRHRGGHGGGIGDRRTHGSISIEGNHGLSMGASLPRLVRTHPWMPEEVAPLDLSPPAQWLRHTQMEAMVPAGTIDAIDTIDTMISAPLRGRRMGPAAGGSSRS